MSEFVDLYKRGGNQAIVINKPYNTDIHITDRGSDWLWSAMCVFIALAMICVFFMFRKPATERLFYYTAFAPLVFMALDYFTLASNLGWIPVKVKYNHARTASEHGHHGTRQVFYARYIGWFMSWPWPIVQASLLGNTPMWQIAFNVGLANTYVVGMLIAAVVHTTYKWGYYVFAIAAGIITCISVMTTTRNLSKNIGPDVLANFQRYFFVVMLMWFIYPLCFGLSEGGNVLQPDSEAVFYGVLDVIYLGILPLLFVPFASHIGIERLGLNYTVNHYGQAPAAAQGGAHHAAPSPRPPAPTPAKKAPAAGTKKKTKKVKRVKKVTKKKRAPSEEEHSSEKVSEPLEEESAGYSS
ncbi:related to Protein MRH1 [Zygosaccharomyces bailii ISA1307]|nr:related to Protein MRH1 [Zygosaccharomyces bailii ISA1307]